MGWNEGKVHVARYIDAGYGRSRNACDAEARGLRPKTRLIQELRAAKVRGAQKIVEAMTPREWHHTGLRAMRTDYFDPATLPDEARDQLMVWRKAQEIRRQEEWQEERVAEEAAGAAQEAMRQAIRERVYFALPEVVEMRDALARVKAQDVVGPNRVENAWSGIPQKMRRRLCALHFHARNGGDVALLALCVGDISNKLANDSASRNGADTEYLTSLEFLTSLESRVEEISRMRK